MTLSGLLNAVDGLWSCCREEHIIVFTTNHKDRLDPALLRPGRMDKQIHLSYCNFSAFKQLVVNYLCITLWKDWSSFRRSSSYSGWNCRRANKGCWCYRMLTRPYQVPPSEENIKEGEQLGRENI